MITYKDNLEGVDWEMLRQDLISDNFHNGRTTSQLRRSFENSTFVAMGFDGIRCIANGRILSDGVGNAFIIDVWTQRSYRSKGVARNIMQMLMNSVPGQHIYLQTDEAVGFYEKLGFKEQPKGMSIIVGAYLQNDTRMRPLRFEKPS